MKVKMRENNKILFIFFLYLKIFTVIDLNEERVKELNTISLI